MHCAICAIEQVPGSRFCRNCGWASALAPPGHRLSASEPGSSAGKAADLASTPLAGMAVSRQAGLTGKVKELLRGLHLAWERSPRLQEFVRRALADPGGLRGFALVAAVCLVLTLVLWGPLSLPATWIDAALVKWITPRSCEKLGGFALAEICAYATAVMLWLGSALALGLAYLLRRPLARLLEPVVSLLPGGGQWLVTPVLSTLLFTMVWAGNSFHWWTRPGIVRDGLFPVLIGLLTHLIVWHGPGIQGRLAGWVERRDQISFKARLGLLFVVMYLIALVSTNLLDPAKSDQAVAILGLLIGYLMLSPRHGGAPGPLRQGAGGALGRS